MPGSLRLPSKEELPTGPLRTFVEELHLYFREANHPDLARIVAAIEALPSASVSRETVRRLLKGKTTSKWVTVDAVFRALCQMAGRDPDLRRWEPEGYDDDDAITQRAHLRKLWGDVVAGGELEASPLVTPPRKPEPPAAAPGGWGTPQRTSPSASSYPDEPPF